MHQAILNNRDLYGLPRKFNISFDNGGQVSVCADTNDIAFYAVRVPEGAAVPAGIYFRVQLCGITGHRQFAQDCGLLITPSQAVPLAAAMVRVFIENGDRTNRKKARLKYLVDDWGHERFWRPPRKTEFRAAVFSASRLRTTRGHATARPYWRASRAEADHHYIGVVIPVGRMLPEQMRAIADVAETYGRGDIRLTAWQNLMIPHIASADLEAVKSRIVAMGFHYRAVPSLVD